MTARESEADSPRTARRLDQDWKFRIGALDGIWEVWRPEENDQWQAATLPHCFNAGDACDPDRPYYRGHGWYRASIPVKNPFVDGRTILHFQGAGQTTSVWVGSTLVGTHKGGYDEFAFDLTEAIRTLSTADLKDGVRIAVLCDNSPDLERVPSDLSDFCLYGGLYRHVSLVYLPALALDAVHILPTVQADGSAKVSVSARLYNPAARKGSCKLALRVLDAAGHTLHESQQNLPEQAVAQATGFLELATFAVGVPQLWSPTSPYLYRCQVTLTSAAGETHLEERFGIRQIEFVEHGPFRLNGQRLLLRGTHRHADHAGLAAAMPDDLVRQEMTLIREMGANFIRLAHYQQDRLVLDLCDELGLMVWEEVPWCRAGVGNEAFQQNVRDMLHHMIDQHFNHPSIILWGLGNEDDWPDEYPSIDKQAIRSFMTELRDMAHGLDHSRLTSLRRCDFARDIPDVYSPSIWAGWYRGNYREYEDSLVKERDRVKRLIHIEWGADSMAGRHSEDPDSISHRIANNIGTDERGLDYLKTGGPTRVSSDGDWSETYACQLFDWYLKTQEKLDWLTGSAQWVFKDFASPLRGDNDIPRMNQKGVVERDLTRKESYFVFQSYWAENPMVHIYGHSWPMRGGHNGQLRRVQVYSNGERVELFLNGASAGVRVRDSQDFPAAGLRWDVAFQPGANHLRAISYHAGKTLTDEIDLVYQTEPWGPPVSLLLTERDRRGMTSTVDVQLVDAMGNHCLDARNRLRFSLAGEGRLLDNLGTSRGSRELNAYNGRATISLERKSACTLGVASEGLPTAFLKLPS